MTRLGLFIYDNLGGRKILTATKTLDLTQHAAGAPLKSAYTRAFEYSDCWVEDARLVSLNARDAAAQGAEILTRTTCTGAARDGDIWRADIEGSDGTRQITARAIVNAGGPWVGDILNGKRVLELGPGSDLGVGLYLLSKGAGEYNAVDVNNLVQTVPQTFYEELFTYLKSMNDEIDELLLRGELDKTINGRNNKLNYVCRNDFNISSALDRRKVDVVFSQAAFEHFDNIEETIESLSNVAVKGAIAIILIDLKTHSRWIRDKDPINIYRYPDWIYRSFHFRGIPNRVRPYQYKDAFKKHGWGNVKIEPGKLLSDDNFSVSFQLSTPLTVFTISPI